MPGDCIAPYPDPTSCIIKPSSAGGVPINQDGRWRSAFEALGLPSAPVEALRGMFPWLGDVRPRAMAELAAEALYAPYLARQAEGLRALQAEERVAVPAGLDFSAVPGLSLEMRQRKLSTSLSMALIAEVCLQESGDPKYRCAKIL